MKKYLHGRRHLRASVKSLKAGREKNRARKQEINFFRMRIIREFSAISKEISATLIPVHNAMMDLAKAFGIMGNIFSKAFENPNKCPDCFCGIVWDMEFDKWFTCSNCHGKGIRPDIDKERILQNG